MKNLITTAILFLALSAAAQKHVKTSGTHFADVADSKKWNNQTGQDATSAQFNAFTGETYVTFVSDQDIDIKLEYTLKLSQGEADVVFSGEGKADHLAMVFIRHEGKGASSDERRLHLEAGKEYRLVFRGKKSSGSFACSWTEL